MRKIALTASAAIWLGLLGVGTASAQLSAEQQSAMRANCRGDFMSKCSGVTPGTKDAVACLQKNVATLSAGCKAVVSTTLPKPAQTPAAAPAPKTEAAPPPPPAAAAPAPPPAPAVATPAAPPPAAPATAAAPPAPKPPQAPKPAAAAKPAAPKPAVAAAPAAPAAVAPAGAVPAPDAATGPTPQQMSAIKFSCGGDFSRNCKGVAPGGPEALACLQRAEARLTPNCQTALADVADQIPTTPAAATPAAAVPVLAAPPPPAHNANIVDAAVMLRACKLDMMRYCSGAELGEGRKVACLTANGPRLTARCRTALKITAPIR